MAKPANDTITVAGCSQKMQGFYRMNYFHAGWLRWNAVDPLADAKNREWERQ
jgi:hypothetical protein